MTLSATIGYGSERCAPILKGYKKSGNQCRREKKRRQRDKALKEWNNAIAEWSLGCIQETC